MPDDTKPDDDAQRVRDWLALIGYRVQLRDQLARLADLREALPRLPLDGCTRDAVARQLTRSRLYAGEARADLDGPAEAAEAAVARRGEELAAGGATP